MEINVTPPINKQLTQEWYDNLALNLMNNYQLKRKNKENGFSEYNFSEIEIYATFDIDQQDRFRHKTEKANIMHLENTFEQKNSKIFYWHYSGTDIVMGDGKSFYCGILIRGIQRGDEWIYGPGRVAYPSYNNYKEVDLELVKRDTIHNYAFVKSHVKVNEITVDNIFKLPRHNLAISTLHKKFELKDDISTIEHFRREVRYIRLPSNFLKRGKKDLPEDYASIVRKYL